MDYLVKILLYSSYNTAVLVRHSFSLQTAVHTAFLQPQTFIIFIAEF